MLVQNFLDATSAKQLPAPIARWIHDKCGKPTRLQCETKEVASKKRRREPETHEHLTITTDKGYTVRVILDASGDISFVGARADSTGEADVRELLELISPDVSRHDWIRVGNALKHKTDIDGFALWSEWSKRSKQPSPRLEYEWRMLGGGQPCSLATLVYLARAENGAAVDQILARSDSQEIDRTTEALQYEQVLIW